MLLAILGLALIASTVGALAAWWLSRGMRLYGSVLFPAIGGLFLLMRRRSGSIEFVRNAQQIRVTLTSIVWRRHILVFVHDLEGLTIMPSSFKDPDPQYELCLLLNRDRTVLLLRSKNAARLEAPRALVSAFLLNHHLLQAGSRTELARSTIGTGAGKP